MRRHTQPKRSLIATLILVLTSTVGCGHSEREWQAKLTEVSNLQAQLQAEQQAHGQTGDDLIGAKGEVDELKERLRQAGVDVEQLNASLGEQRSALEGYRRRAEQLDAVRRRYERIGSKLEPLVKLGLPVTVSVRNNRMVITVPTDVLFDSGKVELRKDGASTLRKVAEIIGGDAQLIERTFQVAGHTDNRRPVGGPYKDNWELSLMRARQVLIFLIEPLDKNGGGLNPKRWSAAGYGEADPIAPNTSPEEMAKNRRIEIVVVPNEEETLDLQSITQ